MEDFTEVDQVEILRKSISKRITAEADRLVDELFDIAYDSESDPKVKLSAINILLDRSVPKMGIQHRPMEELEEKASRKAVRMEIEQLLMEMKDD